MDAILAFIAQHGYALVFAAVFAEQIGLPVPAIPILLGIGALATAGAFSLPAVLGVAVLASLVSDLIWYELGRQRGHAVLNLICRISLEPDSCVRRTENLFARHGARSLLFAKFIPGLSTAAPPLAGTFRMRRRRFLLWDMAGAVIWAGTFMGLGYVFSAQLEQLASFALRLGKGLGVWLGGALAAYIAWKYAQRQRFLRELRIARITPEELKARLEAGENIVVVDLRHSLDFEADNTKLPRALLLTPEELDSRQHEIPRDRDVVLYCT